MSKFEEIRKSLASMPLAARSIVQDIQDSTVRGEWGDEYHTLTELYEHRKILFLVVCRLYREQGRPWKSHHHHPGQGECPAGFFICGINTPQGPATYHYKEEDWDMFDIPELPHAPWWDGHTPDDAIRRLGSIQG